MKMSKNMIVKGKGEERLSDANTPSVKINQGEYDGAFIKEEKLGLTVDFEDDLSFDDCAFEEDEMNPFEML